MPKLEQKGSKDKAAKPPARVNPPTVFRIDPADYGNVTAESNIPRTIQRRVVLIEETIITQEQSANNATTGYELADTPNLDRLRSGKSSDIMSSIQPDSPCYSTHEPKEEKAQYSPVYSPRPYTGRDNEPLMDRMIGIRKALQARYSFLAALGLMVFLAWGAVRLLKQSDREPREIKKHEIAELENAIKPELMETLELRELQRIERATNPEKMGKYLRAVRSGIENTMAEAVIIKTFEIAQGRGLTLGKILDIYDFVRNDIRYVTFLGEEFPRTAERTLEDMMGDSKDKAVLFAAMCLALDTRVKIIVADDHVYNGIRLSPHDSKDGHKEVERSVRKLISARYGSDENLNSHEIGFTADDEGLWLVIDAANPGDNRFPPIFESRVEDVYVLGKGDGVLRLQ